ncbi:MAG TPA: hypothetical protein VNU21_24630 [Usitatibacter sp.]|nr:hypothetical protein [Usitatibacter sp.]
MATSPLDPSNLSGRRDRSIGRGHGTRALGPSDSSDSGSDLMGAPGLARQVDGFGLDRGNTNETEESFAGNTAGPDVGDANLDSDSDRMGTGETAAASRDVVASDGSDIDADHIEALPLDDLEDLADLDDLGDLDDDEANLRDLEDRGREEEEE